MTKQQLIEDYQTRLNAIATMLRDLEKDGTYVDQHKRLVIKRGCYNTFLTELERMDEEKKDSNY